MREMLNYDDTYRLALLTSDPMSFIEKRWGDSKPYYQQFIAPLADRYTNLNTMEIGSGFGRYTKHIVPNTKLMYAIDPSLICRKFLSEQFKDIIVLHPDKINHIPNNSIDLAFSFSTMLHFNKDEMLFYLKHIGTKLKSGGHFVLHYMNPTSSKSLLSSSRYVFYEETQLTDLSKPFGLSKIKSEIPQKAIIPGHTVMTLRKQK